MKFKRIVAAIMTAAMITTTAVAPSSYNPMSIVCEAASSTKIAAPSIKSTSSTENSVGIKWGAVTGADAYAIYSYNSTSKKYEYLGYVSGTSCTIDELNSNTKYYYKVASCIIKNKKLYPQSYSSGFSVTTKAKADTSADKLNLVGWSLADAYDLLTDNGVSKSKIVYKTDKGKKIYVKHNFEIISQKVSNGKIYFTCKRVKYTGIVDAAYDFINSDTYKEAVVTIAKAKEVYNNAQWFINLLK